HVDGLKGVKLMALLMFNALKNRAKNVNFCRLFSSSCNARQSGIDYRCWIDHGALYEATMGSI
ncbi:MAG: hypothetical protein ABI656_07385, partial [bacterium]